MDKMDTKRKVIVDSTTATTEPPEVRKYKEALKAAKLHLIDVKEKYEKEADEAALEAKKAALEAKKAASMAALEAEKAASVAAFEIEKATKNVARLERALLETLGVLQQQGHIVLEQGDDGLGGNKDQAAVRVSGTTLKEGEDMSDNMDNEIMRESVSDTEDDGATSLAANLQFLAISKYKSTDSTLSAINNSLMKSIGIQLDYVSINIKGLFLPFKQISSNRELSLDPFEELFDGTKEGQTFFPSNHCCMYEMK
jgi:hypothetical protein